MAMSIQLNVWQNDSQQTRGIVRIEYVNQDKCLYLDWEINKLGQVSSIHSDEDAYWLTPVENLYDELVKLLDRLEEASE
jgi:hypothetical protein